MAHNKTLAAQLCAEFKEFFPNNAVEYFVSYYDYYQPEAYIPHTDTYIAKDASTNDEIDRLRLSATCALLERRDEALVLIILHISHFPLATVCKPLAESISNLFTDSFGRRCSTG